MSDKQTETDKPITKEKVHESSDAVQKQVDEGIEDLGKGLKKYMEQRKQGLRDIHSGRILGDQPVFFDSQADDPQAPAKGAEAKGAEPQDKGKGGDGREFKVDSKTGDSEYTVRKGDNLTSIATDYLKQKHKDDPDYEPSREELRDAIKDIAKASGIDDPNKISIDQKLKIPKDAGDDGARAKAPEKPPVTPPDKAPEAKTPDKQPDAKPEKPADKPPEQKPEKPPEKEPDAKTEKPPEKPEDDRIARDGEGRPSTMVYPDGTARSYEYDEQGNVSRVTHPDGSSWTHTGPDDTWTKDGSEPSETWEGKIKVRHDGTFEYYNEQGEGGKVKPDGSESDTGVTERDDGGRPSDITYPDGGTRHIEYGPDGQPKSITNPDGSTWTHTGPEDTWTKDGSEPPETWEGKVEVKDDGTFRFYDAQSKESSDERPDGTASGGGTERTPEKAGEPKKIDYGDGTSGERTPTVDGGYTEKHTGPKPEDNYEIQKTPDGKYKIKDDTTGGEFRDPEKPDVRVERARVTDNAEEKIKDPAERKRFYEDMKAFEKRAKEQGLSPEEVAKTYQEISKMMEHKGDTPTKESDRIMAAEQVMHQAAVPTEIDQGQHSTCNVATVESRTYTRKPSEAARLVADVATTGSYTANDGKPDGSKKSTTVTLDPESMKPDPEGQKNPPTGDDRSYASQLFQVTAANIPYQRDKGKDGPDIRYEQHAPGPHPDTGERLLDYSKNDPKTGKPPVEVVDENGQPEMHPGLTDDQIVAASNAITGEGSKEVLITHEDYRSKSDNKINVSSEKEFNDTLARLKAEGKLPVIIGVHSGNYPFYKDSEAGKAGGSGGGHAITVTDYDPGPEPKVEVDNQWGEDVDHTGANAMTLHELYMATRRPTSDSKIEDMERDVEWDREHNTIDTQKEFELIRDKHDAGKMTDEEYQAAIIEQMQAAAQRWEYQQATSTFDMGEYERALEEMDQMIDNLPPDKRLDALAAQKDAGLMSLTDYADAIRDVAKDYKDQMEAEAKKGALDPAKVAEMSEKLEAAIKTLSPDQQLFQLRNLHKKGIMSDEDYKRAMVETIKAAKEANKGDQTSQTNFESSLEDIMDDLPPEMQKSIMEEAAKD